MFTADLIKAYVHAHIAVGDNFYAALFKLGHTLHHHIFFKLKSGNSIGQKPSRAIITIIDRDLHTGPAQHIGRSQSPWARADDADGFPAGRGGLNGLHPSLSPGGIGDIFLN